jgi:hypothetical protein
MSKFKWMAQVSPTRVSLIATHSVCVLRYNCSLTFLAAVCWDLIIDELSELISSQWNASQVDHEHFESIVTDSALSHTELIHWRDHQSSLQFFNREVSSTSHFDSTWCHKLGTSVDYSSQYITSQYDNHQKHILSECSVWFTLEALFFL